VGDSRTDGIHDERNEYQRRTIHGFDPKGVAMARWHYGVGGTRRGPVGDAELRRLADAGTVRPTEFKATGKRMAVVTFKREKVAKKEK